MECPWRNSDASYDARTSMSNNLNAHLDDLEDKPNTVIDNDYLNFHRLVMGQPPKHKPMSIKKGNDLGNSTGPRCHENIESEQSNDSDVEVLDNAAVLEQRIPNSFVPSTAHIIFTEDGHAQAIESASAVEFRRCLMSVLTKPFDAKEYGEICKLFKDGAYSRSYPDVGQKIIDNRYKKEKRLNVFRGFFFWLQNVTQEGSFKPWEDDECLAV